MYEDRQRTFGGTFRQFCKDLKEMADMTSLPKMHDVILNNDYRKRIQDMEFRIIWATQELEASDFFLYRRMEIVLHINGFFTHWEDFRKVPEKWDIDRNEKQWKHPAMRFAERDWKTESHLLSKYEHKFKSAMPRGWEEDPEWTKDFRADVPPKDTTQTSYTGVIPFGLHFRMFVKAIYLLIKMMNDCIHNETPETAKGKREEIRNQEILIRKHVEGLSKHQSMNYMGAGLYASYDRFMRYWECLRALSLEWERLGFNYNEPASNIDKGKLEKDRDTLMEIHISIHWARPRDWDLLYRPEWKRDVDDLFLTESECDEKFRKELSRGYPRHTDFLTFLAFL